MECRQPEGPGPLWERRWQWHSSLAQDRSDQVQMRNQIEHTRQEVQKRKYFEAIEQRCHKTTVRGWTQLELSWD